MNENQQFLAGARELLLGAISSKTNTGLLTIDHPNGFTKMLLNSGPSPYEYRVHQWRPNAISDIHSHTSDFRSVLLTGEMIEDRYLEGSGAGYTKVDVWSEDEVGGFEFSAAHICSLALTQTEIVQRHEYRAIDTETPHRVRVGSHGALTIVGKLRTTKSLSHAYWPDAEVRTRQQAKTIVPVYRGVPHEVLKQIIRRIDELSDE